MNSDPVWAQHEIGTPARQPIISVIITLLLGVIITISISKLAQHQEASADRAKFNHEVDRAAIIIEERLKLYAEKVLQIERLYAASNSVEPEEWRTFINSEQIRKQFPAMTFVSFVSRVRSAELEQFEAQRIADGLADFHVRCRSGHPPGYEGDHYIATYLDGDAADAHLAGNDLLLNEIDRSALSQAALNGEMVVTPRHQHPAVRNASSMVDIILPIYRHQHPQNLTNSTMDSLEGWVVGGLDPERFATSIRSRFSSDIGFSLRDGPSNEEVRLLYADPGEHRLSGDPRVENAETRPINIGDKHWIARFTAYPGFFQRTGAHLSNILLGGGLLCTLLLAAIIWVSGTTQLTARKLADRLAAERTEAEELFRSITTTAQDGIIVMDSRGHIAFWNDAATRIFGYEREEVFEKNVHDILAPSRFHAAHHGTFPGWQASGDGSAIGKTLELDARRKDGSEFPVELSLSSLKIRGSWHAVGIVRDISLRKEAEAQMRRAKEAAEESVRVKSEFLANMSHEIRTPMNGILGMIDLTLDMPMSEEQREYLDVARLSARNLMSVLNNVLDFSKAEAGMVQLDEEDFVVEEFVEKCVAIAKGFMPAHHIDCVCAIDPCVPRVLHGDQGRLGQVLGNILNNAVKFSLTGGVILIYVTIEKSAGDSHTVHFGVSDQGIGIAPEKQQVIFSAFTQADSSTVRKYGGTGLGLAICRQLVDLMGGSIWVRSKEGIGSAFHFTVQLHDAHAAARPAPVQDSAAPAPSAPAPAAHAGLRVLLVEDNHANKEVAARMLAKEGCEVFFAGTGEEAVAHTQENIFDIILMDIQMPVMDGIAATQTIRWRETRTGLHVPIIALTAHAMQGDRERFLAAGMDDYLSKPFSRQDLAMVIAKWCRCH